MGLGAATPSAAVVSARCSPCGGSGRGACGGVRFEVGDAEIEDLGALPAECLRVEDQDDVVRLQIAVENARSVRCTHRRGDLTRDAHRLLHAQAPLRAPKQASAEHLSFQELHENVRSPATSCP